MDRTRGRAAVLVVALAGCAAAPVSLDATDRAAGPPDPGWFAAAPLPAPRQECAVVASGGWVVVIGGFDEGAAMVAGVEAYDPAADTWEPWPALPEPLHHANAAVLDGALHVAGGLGDGFVERGVHWVLAPGARAWDTAAELPPDRAVGAAATAVVDGRLHLVGGLQAGGTVALHSVYDPATDSWEALPDAPRPRDHGAAGVVGGALVVAAGRADGIRSFVAETDRWDGGWEEVAPVPTPRGGVMSAVHADGRLHLLGGEGSDTAGGVFGDHEVWDPNTDAWEVLPPMATPRHGTGAAFVDGTLWVPGGADVLAFGAVDVNEGWRP